MEDILISIDSKYRDFTKYPDESNFSFILQKIYKNIVSVKLVSLELTNSINYISSSKKNNYIILHLPNKLNDSDGITLKIDETQSEDIDNISTQFSSLNLFNSANILSSYPEKYFYIFYLYNPSSITINFNSKTSILTINIGWYSIYGLVKLIQKNIQTNISENVNFSINSFNLKIFDRRYSNNIRIDSINSSSYDSDNLTTNLTTLKNFIYSSYIIDLINFTPVSNSSGGILDKLYNSYSSIYHVNNTSTTPTQSNILLYNLNLIYDSLVSFTNDYTDYYYNYVSGNSILTTQFTKLTIRYEDIPSFEIEFDTSINNNVTSVKYPGVNINSLSYPSLGYYLGYRINNGSYLLSPTFTNGNLTLTASKKYNTIGEDYIFLRINDWGNFDFFNQVIFSKIFLRSDLTSINKTNNYINREYVFRQLTNISKLDIQLIDYLGNQVNLNGVDFSFTLSLRTQLQNIGYY